MNIAQMIMAQIKVMNTAQLIPISLVADIHPTQLCNVESSLEVSTFFCIQNKSVGKKQTKLSSAKLLHFQTPINWLLVTIQSVSHATKPKILHFLTRQTEIDHDKSEQISPKALQF